MEQKQRSELSPTPLMNQSTELLQQLVHFSSFGSLTCYRIALLQLVSPLLGFIGSQLSCFLKERNCFSKDTLCLLQSLFGNLLVLDAADS